MKRVFIRYVLLACFCGLLIAAPSIRAQEKAAPTPATPAQAATTSATPAPVAEKADVASKESKTATAAENKPAAATQAESECKLCRWFELQTATLSVRYRFVENSAGVTTNNQLQHNEAFKGRFKFDAKGNYSIYAGVFSGNNFTGSWNNTGWGTGDGFTNLYLKQLYFSAKPVKGLELQFGGLYVARGEGTEITTYDNDAYLMGERLILKRPKELFFDEISVTYAYLGDLNTPNINKRFHRLQQSNYHQFLVSKNLGKRATVSGDYSFQAGTETLRQAIKVKTKELRVIDSFRFENYQRMDVKRDYGFSVYGEKALHRRFTLGGGYAQIDPNYGGLNSDRFNKGKRLYLQSTLTLSPEFSISTFLQHGVANDFAISNRTRVDVIFSYNLLKTLQRTGIF